MPLIHVTPAMSAPQYVGCDGSGAPMDQNHCQMSRIRTPSPGDIGAVNRQAVPGFLGILIARPRMKRRAPKSQVSQLLTRMVSLSQSTRMVILSLLICLSQLSVFSDWNLPGILPAGAFSNWMPDVHESLYFKTHNTPRQARQRRTKR
jgi:hypothetical protein